MTRAASFSMVSFALAGVMLAACASPVVGGECRDDYMNCHGTCVDTRSDRFNCGGCGIACPMACVASVCVSFDAAVPDASMDAGVPDTGPPDGGTTDAGSHPPPCNIGEIECSGVCYPAMRDRLHCGSCTMACAPSDVCAAGVCRPLCDAPLMACGLECIDTTFDPDHCGDCATSCPTGICIDSVCSAGRVGHVVVIGHDYNTSRATQDIVLGNAVLISVARPVRLLTYIGSARASAVAGADNAVDTIATMRSATITRSSAAAAGEVPLRLASADVFLIYAQRGSIDVDLTAEGTLWSAALGDFVARGGIVISLDDASVVNMGTWQILVTAGLFHNTSRTAISGMNVNIVAGGDAVAVGLMPYRASTESVRFDSADTVEVIGDGTGPVVIHRSLAP